MDVKSNKELNLYGQYERIKTKLTLNNFIIYLYSPKDASSLGIIRFFYGLLMVCDIIEERGGSILDIKWGESRNCHFSLFPNLIPLELKYMGLLYGLMWIGAFGIMLGYKFKFSCLMFVVPYWYILLLDKTYWNNHSYLYGILGILFTGTCANYWCSLDAFFDENTRNKPVPYWNYLILKFQVFLLYFYAGLKKTDMEWLDGYSMSNLGKHWVFDPFKIILTSEQIDFVVVHWFGFLLDLTVGFWLLNRKTRPYALFFCSCFHLMNSRLFSIGMFPYVGLATLPIFCNVDWPKSILGKINAIFVLLKERFVSFVQKCIQNSPMVKEKSGEELSVSDLPPKTITSKHKVVFSLLILHCLLQLFLPYSHFITKGFNNWTNGLYGYSWDMMVHSWDTVLVVVKVVDNKSGREHYLDPNAWVDNARWTKHGDMTIQYAQCLRNNLIADYEYEKSLKLRGDNSKSSITEFITSDNISVYIDVWCSLNGRFQQRMFDPTYDLLQANWSPFRPIEWLLPLLTEYSDLREKITFIEKEVHAWSNATDVLFISDFPGLYLENFISEEMTNVSLTIIEGTVTYESELSDRVIRLSKGNFVKIPSGVFHKISTISNVPSCFMYTYTNQTAENSRIESTVTNENIISGMHAPFPIIEGTSVQYKNFKHFLINVGNALMDVFYGVPMTTRKKHHSRK